MSANFCDRNLSRLLLLLIMPLMLANRVQAEDVNLYAAASLTDALTELSATYQKQHPEVAIKKNFAGSPSLAKQIANGAPADIFMSADKDWADYLQQRGFLKVESRKNLLANELVLIAPSASNASVWLDPAFNFSSSFSGRLCTGDTVSVPVGKYAKQALMHYNWWAKLEPRIVGAEDVRTALAFVERGECDLGIVYKTDAQLSQKVKIVAAFPASSHAPIAYPSALTKNADTASNAFWVFLQSEQAQTVFLRYGFSVIQ